ncbi:MAG: hypothetical protein AB8B87_02270 [Granulosicoccus sp.]
MAFVVLSSIALSLPLSATAANYKQCTDPAKIIAIKVALNTFSGPIYQIGDTGPAGGTVFYVTEDGLHGLEAAPENQGLAVWGCAGFSVVGGTHPSFGSGEYNTQLIVNQCGDNTAASLANDYDHNGYLDWYLPSADELSFMNESINIDPSFYWSSTESGSVNAIGLNDSNNLGDFDRQLPNFVLAIRAF